MCCGNLNIKISENYQDLLQERIFYYILFISSHFFKEIEIYFSLPENLSIVVENWR